MVDAQGLGTTVVRVKTRDDLDYILERMGPGESITLESDLTWGVPGRDSDFELLEEGRSLSLIGKQGVHTKKDMWDILAAEHELLPDGTYSPHPQFSFFQLDKVEKAVLELAKTMGKSTLEKRNREEKEKWMEEAGIAPDEKFHYTTEKRDWHVPELTGEDSRKNDPRIITGGAPKQLGEVDAPAVASANSIKKKITKYSMMYDEPRDPHTGKKLPQDKMHIKKIYIEEEAVVNCDMGRIKIDFTSNAVTVHVNALEASYTLGPIDVGHIVTGECSKRLSPGKRLTIALARSKQVDMEAERKKFQEKEEAGMSGIHLLGAFFIFVMAIIILGSMGKK